MTPMDHFTLGASGVRLSRIVLGGHEYLPDGRSRAFNEDLRLAVTPGHLFPDFGGPLRRSVLERAYALGIDSFDVTMDSEKEALGRNLRELPPPGAAVVQTRPEGMVYGYDPGNRRMVAPGRLREEVLRILALMGRERIDILNLGILKDAIEQDRAFPDKLAQAVRALQQEGRIRCAAADSFSGAATYLALLETGAFASLNLNFNLADDGALERLIPAARAMGVRVVVREVFMKGELFRIAAAAGIDDRAAVARAAIRWTLAQPGVDGLIVGAGTPEQLSASVEAAARPELSDADQALLRTLLAHPQLQQARERNRLAFAQPIGNA